MKPEPICGANAVAALFSRRPTDVQRLFYLPEHRDTVGAWCALLAAARKPYRMVEAPELETVAGTPHHGGIVAIARSKAPAIFDHANPPKAKFLLILDGIGNPHNLGAIARSAAFFGATTMLIGEGLNHAMPSSAAYRTAEGGLEHLNLFRTRDLPRAIASLDMQYRTVAASLSRLALTPAQLPRDRPIALVLGNEERGVSPEVLAACRREVCIPGKGQVQSLNVAQAAAVLLHSFLGE
jgi:TrmH RNA methyltransferase